MTIITNNIKPVLLSVLMLAVSISAHAENDDVCSPFKDADIDQSMLSLMDMMAANLWPPARLRLPKQILRMITKGRSVRSARLLVGGTRGSAMNTSQLSTCLVILPCNVIAFSCLSFSRPKAASSCSSQQRCSVRVAADQSCCFL